jgi:hypothetical protein
LNQFDRIRGAATDLLIKNCIRRAGWRSFEFKPTSQTYKQIISNGPWC